MGRYVTALFEGAGAPGLPRSQRQSVRYRAFVPTPLAELTFVPSGRAMEKIALAAEACASLDRAISVSASHGARAVALLARSEGVGSATIEGYVAPVLSLVSDAATGRSSSPSAAIILNGIAAVAHGIETLGAASLSVTPAHIDDLQRTLMTHIRPSLLGYRTHQNWIGGNSYNPSTAAYVPPPPGDVPWLMDDLCAYINRGDPGRHPLVRAALAHAQFELIHPFPDGNGRTGRVIIQAMLKRDALLSSTVVPISVSIARDTARYLAGLDALKFTGTRPDTAAIDSWIEAFADFTIDACGVAEALVARTTAVHEALRETARREFRGDSAALDVVNALCEQLGVTVPGLAAARGSSEGAILATLARMESMGMAARHRRARPHVYFNADVIAAIEDVTAMPVFSQATDEPARRRTKARCLAPMPRSGTFCNRPVGHAGPHQASTVNAKQHEADN